jgi:hypothetical protein
MAEDEKKEEKQEGNKSSEEEQHGVAAVGPHTQLVFECAVCEKVYDNPGMCQACKVMLKPRGE